MAISQIGTPQVGAANNGGNVTLTFSTAPSTDDYVFVFVSHWTNNTLAPTTAGYTLLVNVSNSGTATSPNTSVYYKKMGGTPDTSVTLNGGTNVQDGTVAISYVLRGVDLTTPSDATPTSTTGNSTNPDPPSITTVTDNAWVIAIGSSKVNDATPGTITGYSDQFTGTQVETNNETLAVARKQVSPAGTENPGAWSTWATGQWVAITIAVRPAGTGITVTLGQITETDTAQPVTPTKAIDIGQAVSTQTAQPVSVLKTVTVGEVEELDLAQPATITKMITVGQPAETDLAQAITWAKAVLLGQPVEVDDAQPVSTGATALLGQATEVDTGQPVTITKLQSIAQALEVDVSQPVTFGKQITAEQATEVDLAQSVMITKMLAIQQTSEVDVAQPVTWSKLRTLAQAIELDTPQTITWTKLCTIGQATEVDQAFTLVPTKLRTITQPIELDLAQPVLFTKLRIIQQVIEHDDAMPLGIPIGGVDLVIIALAPTVGWITGGTVGAWIAGKPRGSVEVDELLEAWTAHGPQVGWPVSEVVE